MWAYRWNPETGCPICKSLTIDKVRYKPAFPGGDIPREGAVEIIDDEPIVVPAQENVLLTALAAAQDTMTTAQEHNAIVEQERHGAVEQEPNAIPEFA